VLARDPPEAQTAPGRLASQTGQPNRPIRERQLRRYVQAKGRLISDILSSWERAVHDSPAFRRAKVRRRRGRAVDQPSSTPPATSSSGARIIDPNQPNSAESLTNGWNSGRLAWSPEEPSQLRSSAPAGGLSRPTRRKPKMLTLTAAPPGVVSDRGHFSSTSTPDARSRARPSGDKAQYAAARAANRKSPFFMADGLPAAAMAP
jgi:hypothetical protein